MRVSPATRAACRAANAIATEPPIEEPPMTAACHFRWSINSAISPAKRAAV